MNALEEYIDQSFLMIRILKENENKIDHLNYNASYFEEFESVLNELKELNEEQVSLKLKYRTKTAQVDEKIDIVDKYIKETKNIIKTITDKDDWEKISIIFDE